MDRYKFRAWNGEEMIYGVVPFQWDFVLHRNFWKCIESNGSGVLNSGGTEAKFEISGYSFQELMQFTGLHDKNGREVYEGDLVQLEEYGEVYKEVLFKNGSFCIHGFNFDPKRSVVIGNIHDNPELI